MNKDILIGMAIGAVIGGVCTWFGGKKVIQQAAAEETNKQLEELESLYDETLQEYAELHKHALTNVEGYDAVARDFFENAKKKCGDVDATSDEYNKAKLTDVKVNKENTTAYNECYKAPIRVIDPEEVEEMIESEKAESFSDYINRMKDNDPLAHVDIDEYLNTPLRDVFSDNEYLYLVKDNKIVDHLIHEKDDLEVAEIFGNSWRRELAANGEICVIDFTNERMCRISCNDKLTFDDLLDEVTDLHGNTMALDFEDIRLLNQD